MIKNREKFIDDLVKASNTADLLSQSFRKAARHTVNQDDDIAVEFVNHTEQLIQQLESELVEINKGFERSTRISNSLYPTQKFYPFMSGEERLAAWEKVRGMWKNRKPDPIMELEKMRKEWDRPLPKLGSRNSQHKK